MSENDKLTEEELENYKAEIEHMSRFNMARLWRFAPSGHPFFDNTLPLFEIFKARFDSLGGFSPAISKELGW